MKKKNFIGVCDRIRVTQEGEMMWQQMMKNKKRISEKIFIRNVKLNKLLDKGETWESYKRDQSDRIKYYKSNDIYFFQTAGFEFIFR